LVPGHRRLTYGGLAQWERTRREVKARNAAALAQSVAAQRAEIATAKVRVLTVAAARETAETAANDSHQVGSIGWHRAQARAWASERRQITDEHLKALTVQARARIGDDP
jgi:phosphoribosylanthranilate isomerase